MIIVIDKQLDLRLELRQYRIIEQERFASKFCVPVSYTHLDVYKRQMQDFGVNLICVEDGIDSSKDAGKLMISVLSAVAEIERCLLYTSIPS